ncbi:multicomponent Na+:H+ antiporter subunit A [Geomicrobium halophilum]|uniref:Multicomponent Na+:H+ antiporter subunit A n=1 Tax=Geomicrobium halophilum TaxID=549000 RepID=A0A841PLN0_9BACL|nr:Na+/H+ antiporter subunit A [Geomicrobium halophilum]MBB6448594.1 multicomponent Na+:H+ antiporter subunit A [Geomicrobium halophilum]
MSLLHWIILIPFLAAVFVPLLGRVFPRVHTGWFVLFVPLTLVVVSWVSYSSLIADGESMLHTVPWVPMLDINFSVYIDGLSFLFLLLITGIGALVVLYSIYYLDKKKERLQNFYVYLLMFIGAMLGVVLSDNLIVLYAFWELTSLASTLLIGFWFIRKKPMFGAQKSMLITVFGGFAMLVGFMLLYIMTGTFSIREIIGEADVIMDHALFLPAMILVLLGAFTKSVQFPFHIWLPDAMEAPTPVSAYLHSATMVKAGIYLVARMMPIFGGSAEWFWIILITGLFTMFWGAISAVRQKDLKAILAFSTVSQLGLIMSLLGVGSAALYAQDPELEMMYAGAIVTAMFHLINHSTFKGSLFMVAGIIDHETGTRTLYKLGGLMTIMPVTFTVSAVGLAAMAGIPPFNGFISKEMFFANMIEVTDLPFFGMGDWSIIIPMIAWIASIFTFIYCAYMFYKTFMGKYDRANYWVDVHEASPGLLVSPILLGGLVIILGLFPNILTNVLIHPSVTSILTGISVELEPYSLTLWHGFEIELFMSIGVVAVGVIAFLYHNKWTEWEIYSKDRDVVNIFYDQGIGKLQDGSQWITRLQMTGRLRDYFVYMLVFIVMLLAVTMWRSGSFQDLPEGIASTMDTPLYMYVVMFTLVGAAAVLPFIKSRITFIITIGVLGLMVALFFTIFSAPDLALTQLLVETVLLIVLMLAFRHLPEMTTETENRSYNTVNVLIAASVGALVTMLSISAYALRLDLDFTAISDYFIENAVPLGGGYNIVNVTLVDFRGFDTVLEALVLGIVALAIIMLVKHRFKGGEDI